MIPVRIEEMTRSRIQRLLEEGNLLVNGKILKAGYKLKAGDEVVLTVPEAKELNARPEKMDLEIVYEDDDIAVVNKPRGLVVHPAHGHEDGKTRDRSQDRQRHLGASGSL